MFLANLDAQFIFKRYLLITHKISANFRDFAGQSQKLHGLINVLKARRPRHSQKLHCLINVFKDDKSFTKTIGEAYNFSKILNHLSATGSRMEQSIEAQNEYNRLDTALIFLTSHKLFFRTEVEIVYLRLKSIRIVIIAVGLKCHRFYNQRVDTVVTFARSIEYDTFIKVRFFLYVYIVVV